MRRRDFIIFLASAIAALPLAARAQQKAMPVIGVVSAGTTSGPALAVFRQGLSEAGYVEGPNVAIEYRWAEGHYDLLPALAAELAGRKIDLIVATNPPAALAAKGATSTIPIAFRVAPTRSGTGWSPASPAPAATSRRSA